MAELHIDEPLDEGYWESLGMSGDQARASDPFSGPPPGADQDPFSGQDGAPTGRSQYEAVWLKTRRGIEFIDVFVGEAPGSDDTHLLIFLYEVPGVEGHERWNVGLSRPKTTAGGEFLHTGRSYQVAKQLAEEEASAMSMDAGGNASWRQGLPGERQLALAEKLGIKMDYHESKGEVSDKLNVFFASKTLDPAFAPKRS